jgi:hypothetical protein
VVGSRDCYACLWTVALTCFLHLFFNLSNFLSCILFREVYLLSPLVLLFSVISAAFTPLSEGHVFFIDLSVVSSNLRL